MSNFWFENEAHIAAIYPLSAIGDPEFPPEWLEELADGIDGGAEGVFASIAPLKRFLETDDSVRVDDLAQCLALHNVGGFVAEVRWCVRRYHSPTGWTSGPDITRYRYLYAHSLEDVIDAAKTIVTDAHDTARNRADQGGAR